MTDVFKIAAIALTGGILSLVLKDFRREFAILCAMATGLIILFLSADMISEIVTEFFRLSEKVGINDK
ncbi:MAG: stage III sporulation AC/AD family protein, partial [Firmicutes bacterium]|nr:stage III sporulation AC/AD family protein [Bacillota bacterium]